MHVFSGVYLASENCGFSGDLGDRIEGLYGLTRGNASARVPTRLFSCGRVYGPMLSSHCSNVACHPGISLTMFLIKQWFWCQYMARDIRIFVLACSVCATSKTSNRLPAGLLQSLSVPSRSWSLNFTRFRYVTSALTR